jgi:hypothetical protein
MSDVTSIPFVTDPGKSNPNVIHLDPKRIKESQECKWEKELYDFLEPLSDREMELIKKLMNIIHRRPKKEQSHAK